MLYEHGYWKEKRKEFLTGFLVYTALSVLYGFFFFSQYPTGAVQKPGGNSHAIHELTLQHLSRWMTEFF